MPVAPVAAYALGGLQPYIDPDEGRFFAVRVQPGLINFPAGGVFAESTLNTDAVHTLAANGATAGAFTLTFRGYTTPVGTLTYLSTAAQVAAALNALPSMVGVGVVGSGTAVNGAGAVLTFSGANYTRQPVELPVMTITTAFVTTQPTLVSTTVGSKQGTAVPYVNAGANGSGTAKWLNKYKLSTDSAGNITFGETAVGEEFAQSRLSAPVYYNGKFLVSDLATVAPTGITGGFLDAGAITQLGRLIAGALGQTNAILELT